MRPKYFIIALAGMFLASLVCSTRTAQASDNDADMTLAFGPQQYTEAAGGPQTFTNTFQHCGTSPCEIVVVNGNPGDGERVKSATISINGVQILGPIDFKYGGDKIVRPVVLADTNQLTVTLLAGKPGSFVTVVVQCAAPRVILSMGVPGVSLQNSESFLSAFPIVATSNDDNDGGQGGKDKDRDYDDNRKDAAKDVQIDSIMLTGGTLTSPLPLPLDLGAIAAGKSVVLDADFSGGPFTPSTAYSLTVDGTYEVKNGDDYDNRGYRYAGGGKGSYGGKGGNGGKRGGAITYCFSLTSNLTVPPASPGSATISSVTIPSNSVSGGGYPHQPLNFDDDVNKPGWVVPTAPFVPVTPTPNTTEIMSAPSGDPPAIDFVVNNGLGLPSGGSNGTASTTAEPSGDVTSGGVIFATANWIAAYSTNGGSTFANMDPTTIFPNDAVGFCCDQIVQYVPSIDRFVWLLQGTGYRLAVASPAQIASSGGTAWTYWNLLPSVFGALSGTGFDYPDMSVGNNELYISWDAGDPCPRGCDSGHQVVRTSLSGLQAGGTIEIDYTDPANSPQAWGGHLMQDTLDEIFWAGHDGNTNLRVFSWAEGSNTYYWRDIGIGSWANNTPLSSLTPSSVNWIDFLFDPTTQNPGGGFPGNAVLGMTRSSNDLWFAWSAGTDNNFPQPHVEMVELDRSNNFNLLQQVQIWNNTVTFAYPALATNSCTGEVGLSLEDGGDSLYYANHIVGFWGDFTVYTTTASNAATTRFGDYVTIRQAPATDANPGNLFAAFGYGLNTPGTTTDVHYVLFGRPANSCSNNIQ